MPFHAHFTVSRPIDLQGFKQTDIVLYHKAQENQQLDIMLTKYYAGELADTQSALALAKQDAFIIQQTGAEVLRLKLEYTGQLDAIQTLDELTYVEAHLKTEFLVESYLFELARFEKVVTLAGARLSRNPREATPTHVSHFANLRIRHGSSKDALSRIAEFESLLKQEGFKVSVVQCELNIFDSNVNRDRWWA